MAKKLRKTGTGSSDTTVAPTGSGRLIYHVEGGYVGVYAPSGVEASDTIYTLISREPCAVGVAYTASRHGE